MKDLPLKVNTKKLGRGRKTECMDELAAFFTCIQGKGVDIDVACAKEKRALTECASAAAARPKQRSTINYHLQRLARNIRR